MGLAVYDIMRRQRSWGSQGGSSPTYDPMVAWKEREALYQREKADLGAGFDRLLSAGNLNLSQRKADVRADAAKQKASIGSQLSRLGMANTTVAPTMGQGVNREMNAELNRVAEAEQQRRLELELQRTNALANLSGQHLSAADQYNMANLQAELSRGQTAAQTYADTLDPLLKAQGAYVRGTTAGASWRNPWSPQ